MMGDTVIMVAIGVVALLLLASRRRRPQLTLGMLPPSRREVSTPASGVPRPVVDDDTRRYHVRESSLVQQIDAALGALEIVVEETRLPSVEIVLDEPTPFERAKFDISDLDRAAAFGPEPTVTTVDDPAVNPVDELAAFLAREEPTPLPPQRAARGSRHGLTRQLTFRGDLHAITRRLTPVTLVSRPMRARTPS
jgi:hypothetical protein